MSKLVDINTFERYINLDELNDEDRRKELFNAVHERSYRWNQYRSLL